LGIAPTQITAGCRLRVDEGFLEYLEDIIGTNQYVEKIEEANKQLEVLNEKRTASVQMLKLAEKERDTLESVKNEVETYICYFKFTHMNPPAVNNTESIASKKSSIEPAPELRARLEEKEGSQPSQGTGQTSRCLARRLRRSTLLSRTICLEFIVSH
jgi:hypothetical protein